MSDHTIDGFYVPARSEVRSDSKWPWVVAAAGVAVVIAGGVAFSGGAADHAGVPAHVESAALQ